MQSEPHSPLRGMSDAQASIAVYLMSHCRSDVAPPPHHAVATAAAPTSQQQQQPIPHPHTHHAAAAAAAAPSSSLVGNLHNHSPPTATNNAKVGDMQAFLMTVCKASA